MVSPRPDAGPAGALQSLSVVDFRSYAEASLEPRGRSTYLFGPNGAGKTNLLEAISFLAPGRGLRGAAVTEIGRRDPGEKPERAWAVSVRLGPEDDPVRIGTGVDTATAVRRTVRNDGETVAPGRLLEHLRLVWLTPAQDRLFVEARSERLRFFDRLVFADRPGHAAAVAAYDKALRERMRLLTEGPSDPAWLSALEARLGAAGARIVLARAHTLAALQEEIAARADRPFPQAQLRLDAGTPDSAEASEPEDAETLAARLEAGFARARARDASAGRALWGPHRADLAVRRASDGRLAGESSTGEQKALILNLILAQAARLSRAKGQPNPILLLDEVAAHLDAGRRAALFDEIAALGLQVFLTGTDAVLFEGLAGRALGVHVDAGRLNVVDE